LLIDTPGDSTSRGIVFVIVSLISLAAVIPLLIRWRGARRAAVFPLLIYPVFVLCQMIRLAFTLATHE
jgi:hypothetical protein